MKLIETLVNSCPNLQLSQFSNVADDFCVSMFDFKMKNFNKLCCHCSVYYECPSAAFFFFFFAMAHYAISLPQETVKLGLSENSV